MKKTALTGTNCTIARALSEVGEIWSLLIIRECTQGRSRFDEFQRELGIARNILTTRLGRLVELNILERYPLAERTGAFGYRLTPKGEGLYPVLVGLMQWGDAWLTQHRPPVTLVDAETLNPVQPIAVRDVDGRVLSYKDVRYALGPGATATTPAAVEGRNRRVHGH